VDVDGALWIDTVARALVDIEFRYVGLPTDVDRLDPGGRVTFREMPNGVVLINRWVLRVVGGTSDTSRTAMAATTPNRIARDDPSVTASQRLVVTEAGGELARVAWPGGVAWKSDLARVSLTVVDADGKPMRSTTVWLDDTNYRATTDSAGHAEIEDLSPGPYSVRIVDPRLEPIDLTLPTSSTFTAVRGQPSQLTVRAGRLEDYVGDRCREDRSVTAGREPLSGVAWVIGRVTTPTGEPNVGLTVGVPSKFPIGAAAPLVSSDPFASHHDIGSDGIFVFCSLVRGTLVPITFKRGNAVLGHVSHAMVNPINVVPLQFSNDAKRD
jgi:hypothetical protein